MEWIPAAEGARVTMERRHARGVLAVVLTAVLLAMLLATPLASGCARVGPPAATAPASAAASTAPAPEPTGTPATTATASVTPPLTFAIIGDYGTGDSHERAVARLVASWDPAFVVTAGDDYYARAGGSGTNKYRRSTGAFYGMWLPGSETTRNDFFPVLGNHDYSDAGLRYYLRYFDLPGPGFVSSSGNERYYDFTWGQVHFFMLDSNPGERDGTGKTSKQAKWLKRELAASMSQWNIVVDHHPPYSSDSKHGSTAALQWPFASWGADAVVSGHAHTYERISRSGIVYFVNGLGGAARYGFDTRVRGSAKRYNANWGAQKVTVDDGGITFAFYSVSGKLVDRYRLQSAD